MAPFHERVKSAAPRAIAQLDPRDRVGVIEFAAKQVLMLGLASVPDLVVAAIRKVQPRAEEKDVNSAIALTALYLQEHARPDATRAIVILTDNVGRHGVGDRATRDALWQNNIVLNGLLATREHTGEADVRPLIEATGGEALDIDPSDVPLGQLFHSLHDRYRLTWRAPGGTPKSIRRISIELTAPAQARVPGARVWAAGAYVAGEARPIP